MLEFHECHISGDFVVNVIGKDRISLPVPPLPDPCVVITPRLFLSEAEPAPGKEAVENAQLLASLSDLGYEKTPSLLTGV
ncbi:MULTISPECIES: hypothetical protein [unclassified Lysinibacillus]|uniref:hypothetical protein n=1 Tax=unclassified Lysinibacillus TaxID=2636778 RepID=UPI003800788B